MVIEAGLVAGYVIAWAVRKARRAAGRLDAETDAVIDAGLDRLHAVVAEKLGGHPVLEDLIEEASTDDGQVSDLTRQQVELAVTAGARKDDAFGQTITDLVAQLQAAEQPDLDRVTDSGVAIARGGGRAVTGADITGDSGPVRVTRSGDATADGLGSEATSGIVRRSRS